MQLQLPWLHSGGAYCFKSRRNSTQSWKTSYQGEETYCQDCGRTIFWDMQGCDDVASGPYITESGDLFCERCAPQYDEPDEEDYFEFEDDLP